MTGYSQRQTAGFTILEILVTTTLVIILLTTIIASFSSIRENARDSQRQTDLRTIEAALALYKNKYGRYPEACNGPTTSLNTNWSGQIGSGHDCTSGSGQFIVGLAPEFLPNLPTDPQLNSAATRSGYVYTVNTEGSVFKLMSLNTVETETIDRDNDLFRCGQDFNLGIAGVGPTDYSHTDPGICQRTPTAPSGNYGAATNITNECSTAGLYQTSYAVMGGFSTDNRGNNNFPLRGEEYDTEIIRCK